MDGAPLGDNRRRLGSNRWQHSILSHGSLSFLPLEPVGHRIVREQAGTGREDRATQPGPQEREDPRFSGFCLPASTLRGAPRPSGVLGLATRRLFVAALALCLLPSGALRPTGVTGLAVTAPRTCNVILSQGEPACLLDECAHRACPLSLGKLKEGQVECPYHGWTFNGEGSCTKMPSTVFRPHISVDTRPVREADGFVWVWMGEVLPKPRAPWPQGIA